MTNAGILYDKYTVIQKLQKRGFSHEQAEGIAEVLAGSDLSQLATKLDLEQALHRQTWGIIGVMFAQAAFIIAVLQYLQKHTVARHGAQQTLRIRAVHFPQHA